MAPTKATKKWKTLRYIYIKKSTNYHTLLKALKTQFIQVSVGLEKKTTAKNQVQFQESIILWSHLELKDSQNSCTFLIPSKCWNLIEWNCKHNSSILRQPQQYTQNYRLLAEHMCTNPKHHTENKITSWYKWFKAIIHNLGIETQHVFHVTLRNHGQSKAWFKQELSRNDTYLHQPQHT